MEVGFMSTHRKGFRMSFANGIRVSVQFGPGNYCANYNAPFDYIRGEADQKCEDAEVAIWHTDHSDASDWMDVQAFVDHDIFGGGHGDVCGYLSPEEVAEILWHASIITQEQIDEYFKEHEEVIK